MAAASVERIEPVERSALSCQARSQLKCASCLAAAERGATCGLLRGLDGMRGIQPGFSLQNYAEVFLDSYYYQIFLRTAGMALGVTFICILLGVPETLILSRMTPLWRGSFFAIILGPLLISVVVRTLGWSVLLGNRGLVNSSSGSVL